MNEEEEDGVSDSLDAQEGEEGQAFQNPGHLGTEANGYFSYWVYNEALIFFVVIHCKQFWT
jgi:hypothetical protein